MRNLRERRLDEPLAGFAASGRPLFGVCLGMQVLFDSSEEDAERGLGLIGGGSRRLSASVRVPHMGWNSVGWTEPHAYTHGIPSGTAFYFAHSYAANVSDATVGVTEYGGRFSSAIARGNVFATQFHPEKSGEAGLALYEAFVKEAG
jgi:glutamine amidotransferase